ncbi:MAG: DEAD/DEAH box helicase family protein [Planctomycetota bacterium]|jgi:hypothetical protein
MLVFDEISQISMGDYLGIFGAAKASGRDIDRLLLVGDPAQLPVVTSQGSLETNAASYLKRRFAEIVVGFTRSVKLMSGDVVEVPTEYRLWLRRNALLLAVVGASSTLAETFATSIQWYIAGDKVTLNRVEVTVPFLHRLERWLGSILA